MTNAEQLDAFKKNFGQLIKNGGQYYDVIITKNAIIHKPQYLQALHHLNHQEFEKAKEILMTIQGYKDADQLLLTASFEIENARERERKYAEAIALFQENHYAAATKTFQLIADYKDSKSYIKQYEEILSKIETVYAFVLAKQKKFQVDDILEKIRQQNFKTLEITDYILEPLNPRENQLLEQTIYLFATYRDYQRIVASYLEGIERIKRADYAQAVMMLSQCKEEASVRGEAKTYRDSKILIHQINAYVPALNYFENEDYGAALHHFKEAQNFAQAEEYVAKITNAFTIYTNSLTAFNHHKYDEALTLLEQINHFDNIHVLYVPPGKKPTRQTAESVKDLVSVCRGIISNYQKGMNYFENEDYRNALVSFKQTRNYVEAEKYIAKINQALEIYTHSVTAIHQHKYDEALVLLIKIRNLNRINELYVVDAKNETQTTFASVNELMTFCKKIVSIYEEALTSLSTAEALQSERFYDVLKLLQSIPIEYKENQKIRIEIQQTVEKIEIFNAARILFAEFKYQEALLEFLKIPGFYQSDAYIEKLNKYLSNYQYANDCYLSGRYDESLDYYLQAEHYQDTDAQVKNIQTSAIIYQAIEEKFEVEHYFGVISIFETLNKNMIPNYRNIDDIFAQSVNNLHALFHELSEEMDFETIVDTIDQPGLTLDESLLVDDIHSLTISRQAKNGSLKSDMDDSVRALALSRHQEINQLYEKSKAIVVAYEELKQAIEIENYPVAGKLLQQVPSNYKDVPTLKSRYQTGALINSAISYYFNNFCNIDTKKVYFKELEKNRYLSIVKDKVERLTNKDSSGKLMERTWRNCLFCIVEKHTDSKDMLTIATDIFNQMKMNYPFLFVRSYFYITLIRENFSTPLQSSDLYLYYFNTNYKFGPVSGKNNIFNNVNYSFIVQDIDAELKTMKDKNMDSIDCARAYCGQLEIYQVTREKLESFDLQIQQKQKKRIIIEGPARSGKTIIAMQILHKYEQAKFLLMNYYFYLALKDAFAVINRKFPGDRIFHHDLSKSREEGCAVDKGSRDNGWTKKFNFNLDFVVVDEAQRLCNLSGVQGDYYYFPGFDELDLIATKPNIVIFLGDDYQRINPRYDEGFQAIKDAILNSGATFVNYRFLETIGIPVNLVNSYKYILDPKLTEKDSLGNHTIRLLNNVDEFVSDFNNNPTYSKHYVTLPNYSLPYRFSNIGITTFPETLRHSDYPFFLNSETMARYVFSTYEVISRELQALYLIIPESIKYSPTRGIYDESLRMNQDYLFNHLYVDMTRATQKLVILTHNQELYAYLQQRIKEVSDDSFKDKWKDLIIEEQIINFVYHDSDKSNAHMFKHVLEKNGFEGFIHATEFDNLKQILVTNKLSSRSTMGDGFTDIADQDVIYLTNQFVKTKVRLYYKNGTPTLYHFYQKSLNLCVLVFDFDLIHHYECYFSDGNAASKYTRFTGDLNEAIAFNWNTILGRGPMGEIEKKEIIRMRNAECLVSGDIDCVQFVKKIIVANENTKSQIENQFAYLRGKVMVDKGFFGG